MMNTNKMKIFQSMAMILIVLLVSATVLVMASPGSTYAFVNEGEDCGLNVTVDENLVKVDNLNPGDTKSSYLVAENKGTEAFRYYFDIQKIGGLEGFYRGLIGGTLDEKLELTVSYEGEDLFHGLVHQFEELDMGILQPEESRQIDITAHLSGPDVGNEYQGANVTVEFKFRAVCESEGATLNVRKFRDKNENGSQDAGEPEINGWVVYINGTRYTTPVSIKVNPGKYTVREATPSGWLTKMPTEVTVDLNEGDEEIVWFGNYQGGTGSDDARLIVRKFNDLDGDGSWGNDEPEIHGWKVFIDGQEYLTPVNILVDPGTYNVAEELREGWQHTTADSRQVTLSANDTETVIFGNQQLLQTVDTYLTVQKFHDYNADGEWDADEPEIANWPVTINGEAYVTPVTIEVEPGEYIIREEMAEGWTATTETEFTVNVEDGQHERVRFGNYQESEFIEPPEDPLVGPDGELPSTGEIITLILLIIGLLFISIGMLVKKKARTIKS